VGWNCHSHPTPPVCLWLHTGDMLLVSSMKMTINHPHRTKILEVITLVQVSSLLMHSLVFEHFLAKDTLSPNPVAQWAEAKSLWTTLLAANWQSSRNSCYHTCSDVSSSMSWPNCLVRTVQHAFLEGPVGVAEEECKRPMSILAKGPQ
jgi:hypothetical protein